MVNKVRLYKLVSPSIIQERSSVIESLFKSMNGNPDANIIIDEFGFIYGRNLKISVPPSPDQNNQDNAKKFFDLTNELVRGITALSSIGINQLFPKSIQFMDEEKMVSNIKNVEEISFEVVLKPNKKQSHAEVEGARIKVVIENYSIITAFSILWRPCISYKEVPMMDLTFPKTTSISSIKIYYSFHQDQTYIKPFFLFKENNKINTCPACVFSYS